jgi:mannose-6-phosphate isomerase-like protein (cupin superfamily)
MFNKEEINNAISNPALIVKRKMFPITPSWDSFIKQINYEFHNEERLPPEEDYPYNPEDTIIHGVNIREHFYLMVDSYLDSPFFPEQYEIIKKLDSLMPTPAFQTFTLANFVGGEKPVNIHEDPRHSFYWQCQGKSVWKSYKYDDGEFVLFQEIEVSPGDMIFVPNGVFHSVETPEPRAAISFMFEMED